MRKLILTRCCSAEKRMASFEKQIISDRGINYCVSSYLLYIEM